MDTKVFFLIYVRSNLKSKSNLSIYSLYYAEACNELAGPISASLRLGSTASFEEMSQRFARDSNLQPPTPEMNALLAKKFNNIDPLMRGAIKKDLGIECWLIIRRSKKVIEDNFLNLLCALSGVVFSANCSAIVFLYVNFKVAF